MAEGTGPRLFWRIYLNGLALLGLLLVTFLAIAFLFNRLPAPVEWVEPLAESLGPRLPALLKDRAALQQELSREAGLSRAVLGVYDLGGRPLANSSGRPMRPLWPEELRRLETQAGPVRLAGPQFRFSMVTPVPRAQPVAYLSVGLPAFALVAERVLVAICATLLVVALVSIPMARALSRPLERLTTTARALGRGDLSVRSGVQRRDEVGVLATALDEMAERLEQLIRGEKELLANVSHELRTPLARIRVALELAEEGTAEQRRQYLGDARDDLAELESLVSDVLTAARLDLLGPSQGIPPLKLERVSPVALLRQCAARFQEAHPRRRLDVVMDEPLPEVLLDPGLVRRALDNLLDNARKYSDEGAPLSLWARFDAAGSEGGGGKGLVVVEVRDEGIGIDPADLPKLFTPFFRTDRSRARGTGGVGLGLALARRITEAHGGQLNLESVPGEGTLVRLTLPVAGALLPGSEAAKEGAPAPSRRDAMSVSPGD